MTRQEQFDQFHESWSEINAVYVRYARKTDVSYTLLEVLYELYYSEARITQKEICETCHLPKTTVNAIISGLVKQHYVEFYEIPQDRRQKGISLTDAGRDYAAPLIDRMIDSEHRAFDMLDEETIQMMLKGIREYQKYFNEYLNGEEKINGKL